MFIINKIYDNKMSWSEEVALTLVHFIGDPELIRYIVTISKPIHYKFLIDESRLFHESLRITIQKRWALTKELSKQRKFHQMNSQVPVTCTLPFDNGMYKLSHELMHSIRHFRPGFIRRKFKIHEEYCDDVDAELPIKIKTVNLIFDKGMEGIAFASCYYKRDIYECLSDLEMYEDINQYSEPFEYFVLPYILIEIWEDEGLKGWNRYNNRRYTLKENHRIILQEIMN